MTRYRCPLSPRERVRVRGSEVNFYLWAQDEISATFSLTPALSPRRGRMVRPRFLKILALGFAG